MKVTGFFVISFGAAVAWFAIELAIYLESSHSGSDARNLISRIMGQFRDDPKMYEYSKNVSAEFAATYSWLEYSLLVLVASSVLLILTGVYALFLSAKTGSLRERT